jgi:hypothetical protein
MQGGICPLRPDFSRSSATISDVLLQVTPGQLQKWRELFCAHEPRRLLAGLLERWSFKQRRVWKSSVLDEEEKGAATAALKREITTTMARSLLGVTLMLCFFIGLRGLIFVLVIC